MNKYILCLNLSKSKELMCPFKYILAILANELL